MLAEHQAEVVHDVEVALELGGRELVGLLHPVLVLPPALALGDGGVAGDQYRGLIGAAPPSSSPTSTRARRGTPPRSRGRSRVTSRGCTDGLFGGSRAGGFTSDASGRSCRPSPQIQEKLRSSLPWSVPSDRNCEVLTCLQDECRLPVVDLLARPVDGCGRVEVGNPDSVLGVTARGVVVEARDGYDEGAVVAVLLVHREGESRVRPAGSSRSRRAAGCRLRRRS